MLTEELRSIPLFKNLTDGQRERVAERLEETEVDLGAVLARQGEFAYHLFVVRSGIAVVTIGEELVRVLGPGSSFGEIGILERGQRTANVVAGSPMQLFTMTMWAFDDLAAEMPEFATHAKSVAEERLEHS